MKLSRLFRMRQSAFIFVMIVSIARFGHPAEAHRLNVFAYVDGDAVIGEAYFNDGSPVKDSVVKLREDSGKVLAESFTDREGRFSLPLFGKRGNLSVVVYAGAGHRGEMDLALTGAEEGSLHEETTTTEENGENRLGDMSGMTIEEIERAIRKVAKEELEPLKKEILRLNRQLAKPGITEIAGGIGYIAGLIGVALWALNRKERKKG